MVIQTNNGLHSQEVEDFGTKETSNGVLTAASRLNCGLIMPSGPGGRKANFYVETYNQILKRAGKIDWQPRQVLEVATNLEEFDFGKKWLESASSDWLKLLTKSEISAIEPRLITEGGVLFTKSGTINPTKLLSCLESEVGDRIRYITIIYS